MRQERFQVISGLDEAIDTASMPLETMVKYRETRDIALLQPFIKPGSKPTIFHVRAVPHSLWQSYVTVVEGEEMRYRRAFQCGVERIENLIGVDGVGVPWTPTRRVSDTITIMSDEECNERFSPYEVLEIGSVIHKHSFLPRRIRLEYALPSLCVEALAQRQYLSAGSSPSTVTTTNSSQRSSETDRQQEATAST